MLNNEPIDIVLTYVDNTDPIWIKTVSQYNAYLNPKRYRKWDNLRFWFRGIEQNIQFARTIYLVVSNIEQVPTWLNRNNVKVILHEDIIPQKYLPTFNSTTIEMFLCHIPGLSEHFIYFNDDMFAMNKCNRNDFFDSNDGYPYYELIHRIDAHNSFRMQCRNSYRLACEMSNTKPKENNGYFYIRHSCDPMLRSDCIQLWDKAKDRIEKSLTKFRQPFNYTQYLFPGYSIMLNHWHEKKFDFAYFKMQGSDGIRNEINNGQHKVICLNDSNGIDNIHLENVNERQYSSEELENMKYEYIKNIVLDCFEHKFKQKSKFEI